MHALDGLALAILAELEKNARITVSELARRLGSPNSTIRDRIRRLEEEGVILGYTAIINPEKLGLGIKAVIQATRAQRVSLDDFFSEPGQLREITKVQLLTGDTDEIMTVHARDVDHLKDIIYNTLNALPGLIRMSTAIVLDERRFPLLRLFEDDAD
jgi:Lrp/AsnC family leucine-responsive transcriptional regulator